jgi:hypothetical protein
MALGTLREGAAMDQGFYDTLVQLAKIGSAGVGVAVLLMVFVMIIRGKPVDPDTARLREKFLTYGVSFAVVLGLLALVPSVIRSDESGPVPVRLFFSPNFASQQLSPPKVEAPDGSEVKPGQTFSVQPSRTAQVITVGIDDALSDVDNLRKASEQLIVSNAAATEQTKALAAKATENAPAPAAEAALEEKTKETAQLQAEVLKSLRTGNFARANSLSGRLRTSVVNTNPAVATIASNRQ